MILYKRIKFNKHINFKLYRTLEEPLVYSLIAKRPVPPEAIAYGEPTKCVICTPPHTPPPWEELVLAQVNGRLPNLLNVAVRICKCVLMRWCICSANIKWLLLYTLKSFIYILFLFLARFKHFFLGWKAF